MRPNKALETPLAPACADSRGGNAPPLTPGDKAIRNPPRPRDQPLHAANDCPKEDIPVFIDAPRVRAMA
jgi:hypothetical protein